jgi:predicted amidohydrolase
MKTIKAAAVQMSPVLYSREGTVDKICQQILTLGHKGVKVRYLPGSGGALLPILLLRPVALQDGRGTLPAA